MRNETVKIELIDKTPVLHWHVRPVDINHGDIDKIKNNASQVLNDVKSMASLFCSTYCLTLTCTEHRSKSFANEQELKTHQLEKMRQWREVQYNLHRSLALFPEFHTPACPACLITKSFLMFSALQVFSEYRPVTYSSLPCNKSHKTDDETPISFMALLNMDIDSLRNISFHITERHPFFYWKEHLEEIADDLPDWNDFRTTRNTNETYSKVGENYTQADDIVPCLTQGKSTLYELWSLKHEGKYTDNFQFRKRRSNQSHKERYIAMARYIWSQHPSIPQAKLIKHPEMTQLVNSFRRPYSNSPYSVVTQRNWIREAASAFENKGNPGRPRNS